MSALAIALVLVLASPADTAADDAGKGLIEHYEDLIVANPGRSHAKRAGDLNRLIPKIVDDLLYPAVGFYMAPGSDRSLELTNVTQADMMARYACFETDGTLVAKSDWITIETKATESLRCHGDKQWILLEWGTDEPARDAVREVLDEDS